MKTAKAGRLRIPSLDHYLRLPKPRDEPPSYKLKREVRGAQEEEDKWA
jgi:hypothetical protein